MESKHCSSVEKKKSRFLISNHHRFILILNRNLKPDSIYLRGESNEQNCSLIIGDITPSSVAYDIRMRTRLPRRMYSFIYLLE